MEEKEEKNTEGIKDLSEFMPTYTALLFLPEEKKDYNDEQIKEYLATLETHESSKIKRKVLLLQALSATGGFITLAAKQCGITRQTHHDYYTKCPIYRNAVDNIIYGKKDFFEHACITHVKNGSITTAIYANKTQNADRGYSENPTPPPPPLSDIPLDNLSIEDKIKLLELIQKANNPKTSE